VASKPLDDIFVFPLFKIYPISSRLTSRISYLVSPDYDTSRISWRSRENYDKSSWRSREDSWEVWGLKKMSSESLKWNPTSLQILGCSEVSWDLICVVLCSVAIHSPLKFLVKWIVRQVHILGGDYESSSRRSIYLLRLDVQMTLLSMSKINVGLERYTLHRIPPKRPRVSGWFLACVGCILGLHSHYIQLYTDLM